MTRRIVSAMLAMVLCAATAHALEATDYGAICNGAADDTKAMRDVFAAAISQHRPVHIPTAGSTNGCMVNINASADGLNLTSLTPNAGSQLGGLVYGDGIQQSRITFVDTTHKAVGLDLAGAQGWAFRDLTLSGGTSTANYPKLTVLLAKPCIGGAVGNPATTCTGVLASNGHTFENVYIPAYGGYGLFIQGSEGNILTNVSFGSEASTALVISITDSLRVTSPSVTLAADSTHMTETDNSFYSLNFSCSTPTCVVFDEGGQNYANIQDQQFYNPLFELGGPITVAFSDTSGANDTVGLFDINLFGFRAETVSPHNQLWSSGNALLSNFHWVASFLNQAGGSAVISQGNNPNGALTDSDISITENTNFAIPLLSSGSRIPFQNTTFKTNQTFAGVTAGLVMNLHTRGSIAAHDRRGDWK